jgi:fructoselysine-6-P-deglycase FrlB-like protein
VPTTGPRIQVALDDTTYQVLRNLSKVARLSMSRICSDLITEAAPLLARSAKMIEDAARLTEEAKDQLRLDLVREERIVTRAAGHAFGALASAEQAIKKAAGRAPGGRAAPARGRTAAKSTTPQRRPRTPGQ